jgi:Domain of unknown function (DUF4276)
MVNIKIYIEGGGDGKDLDIRFREAWSKFFKAAGLQGQMPRPVRGKGRKNTYDLFCTALEEPKTLPLLLVDSEGPVVIGHTVWQHLASYDNWNKPEKADHQQAFLMVQVMETWLLADPEALRGYFGSKFKTDKIPAWPELEAVPKQSVFDILNKTTAECKERQYAKGKISFEVLAAINPRKVADRCPHAKHLLDFLTTNR